MAEHGLTGPVIGVTFDGTGYGTDGAVWGGEFLVGDYRSFRRAGHLRYVGCPAANRPSASRGGWPSPTFWMPAVDTGAAWQRMLPASSLDMLRTNDCSGGFNTPLTSSVGRLFDAVAALAGVRRTVSYEGQAAIELEWLATKSPAGGSLSARDSRRIAAGRTPIRLSSSIRGR